MSEHIAMLKMMVRGAYDLQALRMQAGLRLCANFRAKLKEAVEATAEANGDDDDAPSKNELSKEALKILDKLKESYKRLTDGIARNRTLPAEQGFTGDELISTHTELTLVDQYVRLESQESLQFRQMVSTLEKIPIYTEYLRDQRGIGPALAAVLITYFDPHKAHRVSAFWSYAGLDVAPDGYGRSRRQEHLIDREYKTKTGELKTRKSTTYEPWLKMKLMGGLAPSFLRAASPWRKAYDDYKHRLQTDPARERCTVEQWKKRHKAGEDVKDLWTPGRIKRASERYMVKMFLADFWAKWRALEGLEVTPTYHEAKMGHQHAAE